MTYPDRVHPAGQPRDLASRSPEAEGAVVRTQPDPVGIAELAAAVRSSGMVSGIGVR